MRKCDPSGPTTSRSAHNLGGIARQSNDTRVDSRSSKQVTETHTNERTIMNVVRVAH